jgi:hypothetical protein
MSHRYARVALVGLLLLVAAGCATTPRAAQAPPPMPAAPAEIQTAQPATGYIGIPGRYEWRAPERTYVWVPGHWTVPPPGYTWVPGHWEVRPEGSVWVESRWQRS